ncbi:MAG: hypothetical protein DDT19_01526 [Syntrophomonadaceae bacterium]|nr:hypothetical protein [Bacillota bacterium]
MSSKAKTSGKSPVFSRKDYLEMSSTFTQQDIINMGRKFKHSVFKTPFVGKEDLQGMEFEMSPGVAQPVKPYVPILLIPRYPYLPPRADVEPLMPREPREILIPEVEPEVEPVPTPCICTTTIAIVNEDGSPATDTILRNGRLDFRVTGVCCGRLDWSVSVDVGSTLGGSTITSAGVLTAGATSCGSLKVTASCPVCKTSATQYVRVTDAGRWWPTSSIINCYLYNDLWRVYCFEVSGDTRIEMNFWVLDRCESLVFFGRPCHPSVVDSEGKVCPLAHNCTSWTIASAECLAYMARTQPHWRDWCFYHRTTHFWKWQC